MRQSFADFTNRQVGVAVVPLPTLGQEITQF